MNVQRVALKEGGETRVGLSVWFPRYFSQILDKIVTCQQNLV
jgi:hypothetical protein